MYKLWEGSWEDDAVIRDRESGIFTQPDKVHRSRARRRHIIGLNAIHLCEPSPQRTPVLYQAGASNAGREFAAKHAECVFLLGPSKQVVAPRVADIRSARRRHGRDPQEILIFTLDDGDCGPDRGRSAGKIRGISFLHQSRGALTLFSGWTGVDFSRFDLDDPFASYQERCDQFRGRSVHGRGSAIGMDGARDCRVRRNRRDGRDCRRLAEIGR